MSKFKSIPDKISIGGQTYKVEFVEDVLMERSVGRTLWRKEKIWISDDLNETQAQITLLHEILHCLHEITHFSDIDINADDVEEMIISRLDVALYQVLKDNKLYFGEK